MSYDTNLKTPDFVMEYLDLNRGQSVVKRDKFDFHADLNLPVSQRAYPFYYIGSGYDRGHLSTALNNSFNPVMENESFLMTNIAPESPNLNRGVWRKLELTCFTASRQNNFGVWIVTGLVPGNKTIKGGVNVPLKWYKTVLFLETDPDRLAEEIKDGKLPAGSKQAVYLLAWIMDNDNRSNYLTDDPHQYQVSVGALEAITGKDFWSELPDAQEKVLEKR